MITVCISDADGNEFETLEMNVVDVLPYINLIKEFGYMSDSSDEFVFDGALMLEGQYLCLGVK
jgi:hypothetical protein